MKHIQAHYNDYITQMSLFFPYPSGKHKFHQLSLYLIHLYIEHKPIHLSLSIYYTHKHHRISIILMYWNAFLLDIYIIRLLKMRFYQNTYSMSLSDLQHMIHTQGQRKSCKILKNQVFLFYFCKSTFYWSFMPFKNQYKFNKSWYYFADTSHNLPQYIYGKILLGWKFIFTEDIYNFHFSVKHSDQHTSNRHFHFHKRKKHTQGLYM